MTPAGIEEQLRHADRLASLGRLAASFAHDIGTPLSVIAGRAALIADGDLDPTKVKESAMRIAEQSHRIAETIRRFLDFARKGPHEKTRTSLLSVARGTVELIEPVAKKSKVRISIAEGASDVEANVDAAQIEQAVANLITNAIQAMPEGGRVTLSIARAEDEALLGVADEGPGIAESDRERVFEPFYTTRAEGQGIGLGLSVSKSIIESHGGRIELSSSDSGGARFVLHFPLEREEP